MVITPMVCSADEETDVGGFEKVKQVFVLVGNAEQLLRFSQF